MVKENSRFEVLNWQKDSSGRIVTLLVKVDDAHFNLVNIYAPTNPTEWKNFFENLHEYFYPHCYQIIAGDFNCYESPKFGGNFTPYDLKEFRTTHSLADAWRYKHKRLAQCTWFNAAKTIGSRLDKFFVATELLTNSFSCEIFPCVFSDHDSVDFSVELANVNNHGPGIWRLNLDLLNDEVFCSNVVKIIRSHASCRNFFPSLHEKAFDRVDQHFLLNTLSCFGFGETFCRWISLLYCGASMQVIVNGFLTESIPLLRGVRQCDPLSPLLYVLCMEVFAVNLRRDPQIEGFLIPGASGRRFQISQYADDCTCLVKTLFSLDKLFKFIYRYELATEAKLNRAKTEAMWLGAWNSCSLNPHGLRWVNKMKILGVRFGNMCADPENWLPRLSKLENNLNLWKTRSLSMIGKSLIINVLGASKFWFLAKVLPIPEWVVIRFKKLIFNFLWGSKIETVSRATLSTPLLEGGLGLIDIVAKSKALKLSTMFTTISRPHLSAFYLLKYFVGSQLARFRSDWAHLKDNFTPSAFSPSPSYLCCLNNFEHWITRIPDIDSFHFTSKFCYQEFLKDTVTKPIVPIQWSVGGGPGFDSDHLWPLLREPLCENIKTDIAWLITLRGLKVRESLHRWGYINSDSCAVCARSETIAHCFLYCRRTRGVWHHFHHTLSALTVEDFVPNIRNVFFYAWSRTASQAHRLTRYMIQSILYGIWFFRNKVTFHNGRETSPAIVRFIRQDMITRLGVDLYRLPPSQFKDLWCHPSFCDLDGNQVIPKF